MRDLDPARIDLWFVFCREVADERLLDQYQTILSADERRQEGRFHFAKDRLRYRATRALVRTVLSKYLSVEPKDWFFTAGEYGRPTIANKTPCRIDFSISHTQSLILLAVASGRSIGVDAEHIAPELAVLELSDHFFSREEAKALRALPPWMRQERFFSSWTLKESYLKARGLGLSVPLDRFGFDFPAAGLISMRTHSELNDDARRWMFWQMRPSPDHLVSVCAERCDPEIPELAMTALVPLVREQKVHYELVARSANLDAMQDHN